MRTDPAATLRCWAVDVDLCGRTFTIPAMPAGPWLLALLAGTVTAVVPGMLDDGDDVDDLLLDGDLPWDELERAALDAVEAASGMRWWTAYRLARAATSTELGGEVLSRGVDPGRLSLGAYLLAAYRLAVRHMAEKKRREWERELDKPPAGVSAAEVYDDGEAEAAFMAAMAGG